MLNAHLRKTENQQEWRERVGRALERAKVLSGLSLKEFAVEVGRDERQVARWFTAKERPQLDALFASEKLRQPLAQAFAELAGAEVEITVRIRRPA